MTQTRISAFNYPDFRLITQTRFLFSLAVNIQALVMGWQIYEITHDPLYLGLIGLTEAIPALLLSLVAGYIVDRSNPMKIYRNVIRVSLLSALILLLSSTEIAALNSSEKTYAIYLAALITGFARGFASPSLYSIIPQVIPRTALAESSAWITSAFHIAAVTGPAIGGLFFAWKGPLLPYATDCLMLLGGILMLNQVQLTPKAQTLPNRLPIWTNLTQGIRFVFGHQLLLSALALDMFAVLFGGVTALLPIFASDILHSGPIGLGFLRASQPAGALLMSLYLIRYPIGRSAGKILLTVIAGFGLCMIGFGVSQSLFISMILLGLSGALDGVSMVIRGAIVQLSSPEEMRGRIASVNSFFIGSSNEIGAFESGVAAKLLGTFPSVIFGGCMTLVCVAMAAAFAPQLRQMHLDDL